MNKHGSQPSAPVADDAAALQAFDLHQHLPHLLRRAHFQAEAVFPGVYGDQATSRQLALLVVIGQRPGISQSGAAQQVGIDLNTCSDLVARMVSKKLLRKKRSEIDARSFCLHLTAQGARVAHAGMRRAGDYVQALAHRLSPPQHDRLVALLRLLLELDDPPAA